MSSTAVVWILSLTSFFPIDQPNDADYWKTIFGDLSSDIFYTTTATETAYIKNDDITAANIIKVNFEVPAIQTNVQQDGNSDIINNNLVTYYEILLGLTNDFDPDSIATLIQPNVSSKLDYYVLASIYQDPTNATEIYEDFNDNLMAYSGQNGEEQTQNYPSDDSLTCVSPVYMECGVGSNVDTLTEIQYVNIWDELLPNASILTSEQDTFDIAADTYFYTVAKTVMAEYGTKEEYEWDYEFNGDFDLSEVALNLYKYNDGLNGKESTVDVNCFIALTACGDTDICDIPLPWCDGTETEHDLDNGPIDGTSTANINYISFMSVLIVIFVQFITN